MRLLGSAMRWPRRHLHSLVVCSLAVELIVAGSLRWPLTKADIKTEYEYQLAQVVITTAHWQRDGGALVDHFLPTRSVDGFLGEWPYADQEYVTVGPLAFALHYEAMKLWPQRDPIVAAKILGQLQLAGAVLLSGLALVGVFGFWPTFVG